MTRINTNVSSLRGLRNLQKSNDQLNQSLTRLSTGLKINSGKDNPAGLIAGETLRLQVTTIEQSIKNSNRANNVIATADSALGEISGLLNQVRGLVQEGLNDGALSQSELDANQLQIDAALSAINRISANTTFAGDKLIDGSKAFKTSVTTADAAKLSDFQINEAVFGSSSTLTLNAEVTAAAERGELRYSGGSLTSDTTLEIAGSAGSQVLFLGSGSSTTNIRDAINEVSDVTGVNATIGSGLTIAEGAQAGTFEIQTNAIQNTIDINASTSGSITVNDIRNEQTGADPTLGSDASLGGSVSIQFVENTNNSAASVSAINTDGSGNITIQIELGDTAGTSSTTATDITNAIAANGTAASLVEIVDNSAVGTFSAGGAQTLTGGADSETLTLTDNRATATEGAFATLGGNLSIDLNQATGNGVATSATAATDADGNVTVSVVLGTDGSGNGNATLQDIANAIAADQTAGGAAEFITGSSTATNTVVSDSGGAQLFTDGHDGTNNDISFIDKRDDPTAGTLTVDFDGSSANQTLAVAVNTTGDNNDIVVTLATDADGNVTSTAEEVAAAINGDSTAFALLEATAEGNGSELVSDTGGAQTVDAGSGALVLSSTDFGSNEFVEVNVLTGSFETTLADNTTASNRDFGTDIEATINGQAALGKGLQASVKTSTLDASLSFEVANNVANETAAVTITGGGSLFQIGQEVSAAGQVGIGIEAINTARLGGITGKLFELGSTGGKSLNDVGGNVQGADLVKIVDEALQRVSTLRGRLGAVQKNVIETNISTLGVALENISEARSQIVDTDFAQETANLTKAQILSQAGISVVAIANQNPQQVLSLLG